jgi:hypothetical protein
VRSLTRRVAALIPRPNLVGRFRSRGRRRSQPVRPDRRSEGSGRSRRATFEVARPRTAPTLPQVDVKRRVHAGVNARERHNRSGAALDLNTAQFGSAGPWYCAACRRDLVQPVRARRARASGGQSVRLSAPGIGLLSIHAR